MNVKYSINTSKLHLSKGNRKIGNTIWSFATVPGNSKHRPVVKDGTILSNVSGTCSKYCDGCARNGGCYAWRDFMLHHNVTVKAWSENTNLLRENKAFDEIDRFITKENMRYYTTHDKKFLKVKTFRINTSGEIENLYQFEGWNKLAIKHPEVVFSVYTKAYDVVEEFLNKYDDTAPNFVVNISQWNHVADKFLSKHIDKFNVFEYDGSNKKHHNISKEDCERLSKIKHCPAVLKNGHHRKNKDGSLVTCDQCRRCYKKTKQVTAVYSH